MQKIIDYFIEITKIPHCSYNSDELKDYIIEFAKKRRYRVQVDKTDNILITKDSPTLSLQAHYDMVCVGESNNIQTLISDGWMSAKNSSLGADNGMAIAMMMALMDEGYDCEYLFTSDEEVGLIGAGELEFDLRSKYMLNLDSEDEAEVYIGCAGGVDIKVTKEFTLCEKEGDFYELKSKNFQGGHSGVDIDKNIPNAIKEIFSYIKDKELYISSIQGGERINSIPVNISLLVQGHEKLISTDSIEVKKVDVNCRVIENSDEIIELINSLKNGVLKYNDKLKIPDISLNLALISLNHSSFKLELSARSMDNDGLESIKKSMQEYFQSRNFQIEFHGKYSAWKPQINDFSQLVEKSMKKIFKKSEFKAIHAGLECAIISQKYSHLDITSIGPNIRFPHSKNEKVEIESVYKTYDVIKDVIESLDAI